MSRRILNWYGWSLNGEMFQLHPMTGIFGGKFHIFRVSKADPSASPFPHPRVPSQAQHFRCSDPLLDGPQESFRPILEPGVSTRALASSPQIPSANANAVTLTWRIICAPLTANNITSQLPKHWSGRAGSPQLARGEDEPMQCCIDGDEICK